MSGQDSNESKPIDFSNREYLASIEPELITPGESWEDAKIEMLGHGMEYVGGQEHMLKILKRMLELQLPFEELVKQLTGFVNERDEFTKHAWENDPLKDMQEKNRKLEL
jgi:hypothetical protein